MLYGDAFGHKRRRQGKATVGRGWGIVGRGVDGLAGGAVGPRNGVTTGSG